MNNFSTAIADGIIKYLSEHPEIIDSKNSKKENCPWMFDKDSGIKKIKKNVFHIFHHNIEIR